MKILTKKGFRHKTLVDLEGYEYLEVFGEDIVVTPINQEKLDLQKDHVQYEVDEQLREDAKIETDEEWK